MERERERERGREREKNDQLTAKPCLKREESVFAFGDKF